MARMRSSYKQEMRLLSTRGRLIGLLIGIAALLYLPSVLENQAFLGYGLTNTQLLGVGLPQVNYALIAMMAAIALNLLVGYTGLLSLGHAGFLIAGGYAGAVFTPYLLGGSAMPGFIAHNAPWFGIPFAFAFGALLGTLLALMCCHLKGFYLTVVTLGFGAFIPALSAVMGKQLGGASGRTLSQFVDTRNAILARNNPRAGLFYVSAIFLLVTLYAVWNLVRSRWGRAYMAIRESEIAARSSGISTYWCKVSAFAVSAGIVSVAGWMTAQRFLTVNTGAAADVQTSSFRLVVMVVLGGMGTMAGPIIGAFGVTFAFGFTWVQDTFRNYLGLLFGLLGLVGVALAPEGVIGSIRKAREVLARRRAHGAHSRSAARPPTITAARVRPAAPPAAADPAAPLLEVSGLVKRFGGVTAINDLDLDIRRGTVHALIGPNGSGKSTFVNVISGVQTATAGAVRFNGTDVLGSAPQARSRLGIARTFQNLQIWRRMTVLENVLVGAHAAGTAGLARSMMGTPGSHHDEDKLRDRAWGMLAYVGLEARGLDLAGALPFPDQRRLEVARALVHDPALLLLDEPAAGMQASDIDALMKLIDQVRDAGVTVLLVEHHVQLVMELSDRVTVLDYGVKIAEGAPKAVREDPSVIAAYLGAESVAV
jgi:branched-chain amino acid transport system permease protein